MDGTLCLALAWAGALWLDIFWFAPQQLRKDEMHMQSVVDGLKKKKPGRSGSSPKKAQSRSMSRSGSVGKAPRRSSVGKKGLSPTAAAANASPGSAKVRSALICLLAPFSCRLHSDSGQQQVQRVALFFSQSRKQLTKGGVS